MSKPNKPYVNKKKIIWSSITPIQKYAYQVNLYNQLSQLDWNICMLSGCTEASHCETITTKSKLLISIMERTSDTVFHLRRKTGPAGKMISGWNELVKPYYDEYRRAFQIWDASGKTDPQFYDIMCDKHRKFKYALRKCINSREKRAQDNLAMSYQGKDFVKFWKHVKQHDSCAQRLPDTVDGVKGDTNISEHWAGIYRDLFNAKQRTTEEGKASTEMQSQRLLVKYA
ncbi:unnamed protein product [Orchesella dallaii]|uniref:Uncharacterized protein n=1 Tax=Orchesella dallaii TaxID=48710 RepID=A0ABP1RUX1_9HEXA